MVKSVKATGHPTLSGPHSTWLAIALPACYVALALAVDTLAANGVAWPISWNIFHWTPMSLYFSVARASGGAPEWLARIAHSPFREFDLFKFLFWFVVPVAVCARHFDWRWVLPTRWTRLDVIVGAVGILLCAATVMLIPFLPNLRALYGGGRHHAAMAHPGAFFASKMIWTFSWFLGWEFMHRYFLLKGCMRWAPRWGWLLVPLSETLYHLQKPPEEMIAMGLFSLAATSWTVWRKNMLLAFFAHLAVEVTLWVFVVFG